MDILTPQLTDEVEIQTLLDDGEKTVGAKRNTLLNMASGKWLCFVDDDDLPSPDYISQILTALQNSPDVVTFKVMRYIDGHKWGEQIMRLKNTYQIEEVGIGYYWHFPPTHLCPTLSAIAKQVTFSDWNRGEDRDWQERVYPMLKTEVFIDQFLYHYYYRQQRSIERTNQTLTMAR